MTPVVPRVAMHQSVICQPLIYQGDSATTAPPEPPGDLARVHTRFTGSGVVVAVIDTGVTPNPRLPPVEAGGDMVLESDAGLVDCDAHGQIAASILAGKPSPQDSFSGIAPGIAKIISVRQTSKKYIATAGGETDRMKIQQNGVDDLAHAIAHVVNMGARIINISTVICLNNKEYDSISLDGLGQAIRYAEDNNALIVASAGNKNEDTQNCASNASDTGSDHDASDWAHLKSFSVPSVFSPTVLSVTANGAAALGQSAPYTAPGPWIALAAPGTQVAALGRAGQPVNAYQNVKTGLPEPISGTSFAAPYVSGQAALLLSAHPAMTARQLRDTITATAIYGWPTRSGPNIGYADIAGSLAKTTVDTTAPTRGHSIDFTASTPPVTSEPSPGPALVYYPMIFLLVVAVLYRIHSAFGTERRDVTPC